MSSIQSEITKYAKNQENGIHSQKKNQSIEMDPEVTEMMKLTYRDIKIVIMLKYLKKNISIRGKKWKT